MILSADSKMTFDCLSEGILMIDRDGIVRYVNPAYSSITKVSYEAIVGKVLAEVRPGSRLSDVVRTGQAILRAPRFFDGVGYMTNMCPIRDADGQIVGGISTVIQMQEVDALNREVEKFQTELKKLENYIRVEKTAKYSFDKIVFSDPASVHTIALARRIAARDFSVLITGESGTGKELYAHSIHNESSRGDGPFVALNCATFDKNLLASELFGYEEGAFTGAKKGGKIGLFEVAGGGTLFLDEISELDYQIQAQLLRVLQEKTVRHVGGKKEIPVDVRIITACNKRLEDLVEQKLFREDLFYRIAVVPLTLPPLRQRPGDIIPLAHHFLHTIAQHEKKPMQFAAETLAVLESYDWPGNIRELRNTVQFASFQAEGDTIVPAHLPPKVQAEGARLGQGRLPGLKERLRAFERREIQKTLLLYDDTVDGKKKAAQQLGISLATLYSKLEAIV